MLKETVMRSVLGKPSLSSMMLENFGLVSGLPFLGTLLEPVVVPQLQGHLEETGFLDQLQSAFRPGLGTETALVPWWMISAED